ncbi:MAG: ABC transporter permease [Candidatus Nanopelagicales bacterium]|jgi:ABC-2 type transport system permease protein
MRNLVKSEFRKAFSTKLLWILTLSALGFVLLSVVLGVYLTPGPPGAEDANVLLVPAAVTNIFSSAGSASIFVIILGIIAMSGEYRNQTITSTFLATPRRQSVIFAKVIAYSIIAFVIAVIMWVSVVVVASLLLTTVEHAPIEWNSVFEILGGTILGLVLYAILGVAIGALITNQVAAVVITLVWIFVVEALLTVFVDWLGKWLPGGALNSILQATNTSGIGGTEALSVSAAALLLIAYTVVFAAAAVFTTNRKDIT